MNQRILTHMTIDEAKEKQFRLVSAIAREFTGNQFLSQGDVGVVPDWGRPVQTTRVEPGCLPTCSEPRLAPWYGGREPGQSVPS